MPAHEPAERPILFSGAMVRANLEDRKTQTRRAMSPQPNEHTTSFGCLNWGQAWHALGGNPKDIDEWTLEGDWIRCPYGKPGDRLWVRETFQVLTAGGVIYRADDIAGHIDSGWKPSIHMFHMYSRITLEITKVRVERVQEISEDDAIAEGISECLIPADDEGPNRVGYMIGPDDGKSGLDVYARDSYRKLWNSINAKPQPVKEKTPKGWLTTHYEAYPWSKEDFARLYPKYHKAGMVRGKPLEIIANPWVWVIEYKKVNPK